MKDEIIAHPETGEPVIAQVSYVGLDRAQLEAELQQAEASLNAIKGEEDQHQAHGQDIANRKSQAEAALADKKSILEKHDAIKQQQPQSGSEGAASAEPSEDSSGAVAEGAAGSEAPSEDSAPEVSAAEVQVPVQVETADEY